MSCSRGVRGSIGHRCPGGGGRMCVVTDEKGAVRAAVVCDNTMGIPGGEIDDGLALLYLRGCRNPTVDVTLVCATHGNAATADTFEATRALCARLLPGVPVERGADAGDVRPSGAAHALVDLAWSDEGPATALLSLGAVTDLAAAERLRPGTLARFAQVCLMGGVTRPLVVGSRIMDELNLSVDADAALAVLASGARLAIADAHGCLPLTFAGLEFLDRLAQGSGAGAELVSRTCTPWIEHARSHWGVDGFVGWDVLAAAAVAQPEAVELVPYRVTLYRRFLGVGLLAEAGPDVPDDLAVEVLLVRIRDARSLAGEVYAAWERALAGV